MRERELFEGSADRKLHRLLHQAEFDWAWSWKHMTHDSRRTRFPLLARPVSDASVRAVIPLARNISAIDNKVNLSSEEPTSELQSLMPLSYDVFCFNKKKNKHNTKKTLY